MGNYPVELPVPHDDAAHDQPHDDSIHTPYSRIDGTRAYTGEVAGVTPTQDASLATKQYVDNSIPSDVDDPVGSSFLLMGA